MSFFLKLAVFLSLFAVSFADDHFYLIENPDRWIEKVYIDNIQYDEKDKDLTFLLVDRQINLLKKAKFYHFYELINSDSKLKERNKILVNIDPQYESLIFHDAHILRNNQKINLLTKDNIKVLQREEGLESSILDGSKTVML